MVVERYFRDVKLQDIDIKALMMAKEGSKQYGPLIAREQKKARLLLNILYPKCMTQQHRVSLLLEQNKIKMIIPSLKK